MADAQGGIPSTEQIREAMRIYLEHAYEGEPPPAALEKVPPEDADPRAWLMGDRVERTPPDAPAPEVRSFALRAGNQYYPHMKVRISRPPQASAFLFSVDAHDAFLTAKPGTPDYEMLEQMKQTNARIVSNVLSAWDEAGLPTERSYMRMKIGQARDSRLGEES